MLLPRQALPQLCGRSNSQTQLCPTRSLIVKQKYTVQSIGLWEYIRRILAVDPNRSNGVPLNLRYRNPPPGAIIPEAYEDPVTTPAGDIADNPYYKRDTRRSYPRLSVFKQADIVGLLSFGSKANPRSSTLRIGGDASGPSTKQLVLQAKQEGEANGISAFLERNSDSDVGRASILGPDGLPPFPSGQQGRLAPSGGGRRMYLMNEGRTEGYPEEYVQRAYFFIISSKWRRSFFH